MPAPVTLLQMGSTNFFLPLPEAALWRVGEDCKDTGGNPQRRAGDPTAMSGQRWCRRYAELEG
jgi:hypothetical protein